MAVTVFPDDCEQGPERGPGARVLAPRIRLLGYEAFKRVCHPCCDMDDCTRRFPPSV